MSITYIVRLFICFLPILCISFFLLIHKNKNMKDVSKVRSLIFKLDKSIAEKTVSQYVSKSKKKEKNAFDKVKEKWGAKLNIFGIQYKMETLIIAFLFMFIIGMIFSKLLLGAGIVLMLYIGVICSSLVYFYLNNMMKKKRKELQQEFMEKLRDIGAYMSVGTNFQKALSDTINSGKISAVMERELTLITRNIYTGTKSSDAFINMYERLQIEEIREFAGALEIFETTGGDLRKVINTFQESYTEKEKLIDTREVFIKETQSTQKILVLISIGIIAIFGLLSPGTFQNYYNTFSGQIIGILLFTMVLVGVFVSKKISMRGIQKND